MTKITLLVQHTIHTLRGIEFTTMHFTITVSKTWTLINFHF